VISTRGRRSKDKSFSHLCTAGYHLRAPHRLVFALSIFRAPCFPNLAAESEKGRRRLSVVSAPRAAQDQFLLLCAEHT
jgi:hypothetical protein